MIHTFVFLKSTFSTNDNDEVAQIDSKMKKEKSNEKTLKPTYKYTATDTSICATNQSTLHYFKLKSIANSRKLGNPDQDFL